MSTQEPLHRHPAQDRAAARTAVSSPLAAFSPAMRDRRRALARLLGSAASADRRVQALLSGMAPENARLRIDASTLRTGLGVALEETRNRRRGQ